MKKRIFILFLVFMGAVELFAQQKSAVSEFTQKEVLSFVDVKATLSLITGQDYSKNIVRNFALTTIITNADGTETKLSEIGPGGRWSSKQKNMIEKYGVKGTVFTLENVLLFESGKKGPVSKAQPNVTFSIKE